MKGMMNVNTANGPMPVDKTAIDVRREFRETPGTVPGVSLLAPAFAPAFALPVGASPAHGGSLDDFIVQSDADCPSVHEFGVAWNDRGEYCTGVLR
jgi:hypothetical protein